mgnify:CR=1 FL=1
MNKKAIKDLSYNGEPMMRCPHCNSWDRNWDRNGTYQCEECDEFVEVDLSVGNYDDNLS